MIEDCSFCYGSRKCQLPEGHTAPHMVVLRAPHMIVLRFDVGRVDPGETAAVGSAPSLNDCRKPLNDKPCVQCKWCDARDAKELFYCEAWQRPVPGGVVAACRVWERK